MKNNLLSLLLLSSLPLMRDGRSGSPNISLPTFPAPNQNSNQGTGSNNTSQGSNNLNTTQGSTNMNNYQDSNNMNSYQGSTNMNNYQDSNNMNASQGSTNMNDYQGSNNMNASQGSTNMNDYQGSNNMNYYQGSNNMNASQGSTNMNDYQDSMANDMDESQDEEADHNAMFNSLMQNPMFNQIMQNAMPSAPNTSNMAAMELPFISPSIPPEVEELLPNSLKPRFFLPPLKYPYNGLEPYIDEETMRIHHDRLHQKYVTELNRSLSRYPELYSYNLGELLANTEKLPSDIQASVINNGGGHYNHTFFWNSLRPNTTGTNQPTGELATAIREQFGSYDNFKRAFRDAALSVFGSGWTWLILTPGGRLEIINTQNHITPVPINGIPLVLLDIWEHAYYLKNRNNREAYINNWFNVINWDYANQIYTTAINYSDFN